MLNDMSCILSSVFEGPTPFHFLHTYLPYCKSCLCFRESPMDSERASELNIASHLTDGNLKGSWNFGNHGSVVLSAECACMIAFRSIGPRNANKLSVGSGTPVSTSIRSIAGIVRRHDNDSGYGVNTGQM